MVKLRIAITSIKEEFIYIWSWEIVLRRILTKSCGKKIGMKKDNSAKFFFKKKESSLDLGQYIF